MRRKASGPGPGTPGNGRGGGLPDRNVAAKQAAQAAFARRTGRAPPVEVGLPSRIGAEQA